MVILQLTTPASPMECLVSTTAATASNWNPRFKQHRKKTDPWIPENDKPLKKVRRFVLKSKSNQSQRRTVKRTVRVVNFRGKNCRRIVDRSTKRKNGCHAWGKRSETGIGWSFLVGTILAFKRKWCCRSKCLQLNQLKRKWTWLGSGKYVPDCHRAAPININ